MNRMDVVGVGMRLSEKRGYGLYADGRGGLTGSRIAQSGCPERGEISLRDD
jgi:hypothetical protein